MKALCNRMHTGGRAPNLQQTSNSDTVAVTARQHADRRLFLRVCTC
jgi:hypothetical protein